MQGDGSLEEQVLELSGDLEGWVLVPVILYPPAIEVDCLLNLPSNAYYK